MQRWHPLLPALPFQVANNPASCQVTSSWDPAYASGQYWNASEGYYVNGRMNGGYTANKQAAAADDVKHQNGQLAGQAGTGKRARKEKRKCVFGFTMSCPSGSAVGCSKGNRKPCSMRIHLLHLAPSSWSSVCWICLSLADMKHNGAGS